MKKINIQRWGPAAWDFLHAVSLKMPNNPDPITKQKYQQFFDALPYVLPCTICQQHLRDNYTANPVNVNCRAACVTWLLDIHNSVNISNKKPKVSLPNMLEEFLPDNERDNMLREINSTEKLQSNLNSCNTPWWVYCLVGLLLLILIILLIWKSLRLKSK